MKMWTKTAPQAQIELEQQVATIFMIKHRQLPAQLFGKWHCGQ
jgi:hypothetical protein